MSKFQDYVPQPFAIYKALPLHPDFPTETHYQNYQLAQCKGDKSTFRLVFPFDGTKIALPPFIIRRPSGGGTVTCDIIALESGSAQALTLSQSVENLDDPPTWEAVLVQSQSFTLSVRYDYHYFLRLTDGTDTWYSELFVFSGSDTLPGTTPFSQLPSQCGVEEFIQLSWSNPDCVISEKLPTGISFMLNLEANMANPDYKFVRDTEEDGQGGIATQFQRLDKRWTFFVRAPEYIADALSAMQLFSGVAISFQHGDSLTCRDIEVDVDWQDPCFANISVSFTADFLATTGCCG